MNQLKNKIILVGGCFDILHFGHIEFLRKAKSLGDYLIVALESDASVKTLKGKGRPIHNQNQRKEILESLKFVDEVIVLKNKMTEKDYFKLVTSVNPSIIAVTKGDPMLSNKMSQVKLIGGKITEIKPTKNFSSSSILNKLK